MKPLLTQAISPAATAPPGGAAAWDLLVIGGGTAGIVAAKTAAGFGASVLLVERERTGGDCLWTGCVPSKALLAASAAAADARRAGERGVHIEGIRIDFAAVMGHVNAAIAAIEPNDSVAALQAAGVRVVHGTARCTGPASATVDGRSVRFRQALVATGSEPLVPPIPGLAEVQALTSDTVWSLADLPRRLVVLGGGSIGCELGQALARLGSQVTIVEAAPRLLMREDPDAAAVVDAALRRDGVIVHTGAAVTAVHADRAHGETSPSDGDGECDGQVELADGSRIDFDQLLVAVGRRPRSSDLNLSAAGVEVTERGYLVVDSVLRTTNRRVWAAGDITGHPQFTHVAGVHGALAASNAILGLHRRVKLSAIPRVTFTQPELASVGTGTSSADTGGTERHPGLSVRTIAHQHVDRAITDARTEGFTRLVLDPKGRIVGATVVGPRAGESLAELVLAIHLRLSASDLAGTVHAYPTYTYGAWDAALAQVRDRLRGPMIGNAVAGLAATRRRWIDLRARLS